MLLNDKAVGRSKFSGTHRIIGFSMCPLEGDELRFLNIIFANKVILCTVDLVYRV